MDCSELWCLASVDGAECKETFDTYDDFEEHFCQKHLDLALFACGAKGCTAQFGTVLQIFRHLAICKRRGKKIKLLQCSDSALESLTALDRAKLLAVQCCVKRAKRANELAEINDGFSTERIEESSVHCSLDGMGLRNSLDDDQLHMPIMEPSETHEMGDVKSGPSLSKRERAVTPARQAAWRMKEQMLLEENMKKKNKPPESASKDTQKKQKKLPVKITDKTRIAALINDDPKKAVKVKEKCRSSHLQSVESGQSRDSTLRPVNSNMSFESTNPIVCTESRQKLLLDKTQNPILAIQKQPRVFESSLPAGPNNPPKIHDVSHPQPSSFGPTVTRLPDYSGFTNNPVINPTLHEIPVSLPPPPLQILPIQASDGCQNNFETNRTLTKTNLLSQSTTFSTSEIDIQQKYGYMNPRGILRTTRTKKKHGFQNAVETVEQTGQMDLDVLSLFSKRLKECKTLEHLKVSTSQAELLEQAAVSTARKHSDQTKSVKANVRLEEEASPVEPPGKFKDNRNLIDLCSDKEEEDDEYGEAVPILLNLFSDKETTTPVLFDPRIIRKSSTPEKSRNDRRNIEGEVAQEKRMEMCRNSDGCHSSSENKKNGYSISTLKNIIGADIIGHDHENLVYRNKVITDGSGQEVEAEVLTDHRAGEGGRESVTMKNRALKADERNSSLF